MTTGVFCLSVASIPAKSTEKDFSAWLGALHTEALAAGISPETLKLALAGVKRPLPRVLALDQKQPESTQSVKDYVRARVSDKRVTNGRKMRNRYPVWLDRIEREYRVQERFILALWGVETDYGAYSGKFSVIQSLVTLAHDGRRSSFFRKELLNALHVLEAGHITAERMKGSWAGAMGQCQFMPSSFRAYAVDADDDGRIDIWNSVPDVLASTANYLKQAGWKDDQTWGRQVLLPNNFDISLTGLDTRLPLGRWQALGVRRANGNPLPRRNLPASLIIPDGLDGQAYLVYDNFRAIRAWNKSNAFAITVGMLSDQFSSNQ